MFNTRPPASLSSQLLARKGQAKPAMRPQGYGGFTGGAAAIAATDTSTGEQVVAYAIFAVVATLGVGIPVAISLVMGDRARDLLDRSGDGVERAIVVDDVDERRGVDVHRIAQAERGEPAGSEARGERGEDAWIFHGGRHEVRRPRLIEAARPPAPPRLMTDAPPPRVVIAPRSRPSRKVARDAEHPQNASSDDDEGLRAAH